MNIHFERLWDLASSQYRGYAQGFHGPHHWRRVERNALLLATRSGADVTVVRLFAVFHDSQRENEDHDPEHGLRAARYAEMLRGKEFDVTDSQFEQLRYACEWHTDGLHHEDPTIGTCWDADRLDLNRVGIIPSPKFMSTAFGREIAGFGSLQPFLKAAGMLA